MQKEEFLTAVTFLGLVYSKELTQEQVAAWYTFFREDDYDELRNAIKRLSVKSKFFPSVAELKEEMAVRAAPELDADEAWSSVIRAIGRYGYYNPEEAMSSMSDLTQNTIRSMGGFQRICASEDNEWLRKDFCRIYNDMKARNIEHYVTGDLISIADVLARQRLLDE